MAVKLDDPWLVEYLHKAGRYNPFNWSRLGVPFTDASKEITFVFDFQSLDSHGLYFLLYTSI